MSGIEPYYKKKFRVRKYRLDPTENYKLDRIRGEESKGSKDDKPKLNIWTAFAIAMLVLVLAFVIPLVVSSAITRRHTDALVSLKHVQNLTAGEGQTFADETLFVVKQGKKYYLFWYENGATINMGEHGTSPCTNFVEINDPQHYPMPVNVKKGVSLEYPFSENPIKSDKGKIKLMDGIQILEGYTLVKYVPDGEIVKKLPKNVDIYQFVKGK